MGEKAAAIRILIVDDHAVVRRGMRDLLGLAVSVVSFEGRQ
jgi:DNA-binding NarL/FixJ family response regulator